jgi:hypothetical protein
VIQRFGGALGALNLNVHFHALVPDGVYAGEPGKLAFHRVGRLTALDAEEVLAAVDPLVARRLRARGESDDGSVFSDPWGNDAPLLAGLAAASVQGVSALAPSGRRPARLGSVPTAAQPEHHVHDHRVAQPLPRERRGGGARRDRRAEDASTHRVAAHRIGSRRWRRHEVIGLPGARLGSLTSAANASKKRWQHA